MKATTEDKPLNIKCDRCGAVATFEEADLDWFLDHRVCKISPAASRNLDYVPTPLERVVVSVASSAIVGLVAKFMPSIIDAIKRKFTDGK